ncbi:MAG: DUF4214 domain-containing protein, partial [Thauera sp.]|nr:DUF4214 domain-containing protein [Thauera sp.]
MATFAELNELYLAYFGRPVDTAGAEFWLTKTPEEIEAGFAASQESQDMYDAGTLEGFITQVYQNVIGRAPEAAGLAHWVGRIESGDITRAGAAIEILHDALATGDAGNVQNKLDAAAAFYAALEASGNGAAYAGADAAAAARAFIAGVFETPVTPEQVAAAVEAVVGGGGGEEPGPEPVPGNEFFLTAGQDVLNGTADNDTFYADVVQNPNNGQQVNSLGSGDRINGGAGTDTLDAEITAGAWVNGDQANSMAIAPRTTSVENIVLKAVHSNISGNQGANTNSEVYVDGKNMVGVQYIGSEQSDANLTVKNMTSEGNGHVSEMTVGMKYTGNKDTHWDASNFKVLFDQDYLTTDSARKTGIFYDILNQDAYDANVNQPLRDYPLGAINFWIRPTGDAGEGTKYTLDVSEADMVGINTHAQLVTLLNGKLAALIATKPELAGLVFQTEGANSFSDTNGRTSVRIDLIDNNAAGRELHKGTVSQAEDSEGGNIYWRRGSLEDEVSQNPVSINVELEKVGLTGRGGELVIGSMNKAGADDNEWKGNSGITVTDTKQGFDEFNVKVLGSNAESSWLSTIRSTNNTLHTINIESAAGKKGGKAGDWADLYVDSIKDIKTLDASAFQGDLTVGAVITDESINKYLGNDLLSGGVSRGARGANDIVKFDYDGGVGDDDIVVSIDGGVILNGYGTYGGWDFNGFLPAARKFEMEIDGNNGDDWIEVNVSPSEGYYSGTVSGVGAATGVSGVDVTWGNGWSGITINGGNGDDVIVLEQDAWTSTSGTLYEEFGWSFNVAFNGNFGLDTIVNFTSGEQEYTNEVQLIDFNGVILHPEYAADPGATPPLAEFKGEI